MPDWPISWRTSYNFDLQEVFGEIRDLGYVNHYNNRRNIVFELIKKVGRGNDKILDIGAAQGNFSIPLAEQGYEVSWNDLRPELCDYVKLKLEYGNIHFLPGNILEMDPPSQYDIVLALEIIEHVAHPDRFMQKLATFIKPNGYLILTTPNGDYFRNSLPSFCECPNPEVFESQQFKADADGHIFLLKATELHALTQKTHLKIVDFFYYTNCLTNGHLKTWRILPFAPRRIISYLESLSVRLPVRLRRKIHTGMAVLLRKNLHAA